VSPLPPRDRDLGEFCFEKSGAIIKGKIIDYDVMPTHKGLYFFSISMVYCLSLNNRAWLHLI